MIVTGSKNLTKKEILSRRAESEARPQGGGLKDVKPPKWLDRASKREWRRIVKLVRDLGILTEADLNTLAAYCDATVRYVEASQTVQEEGPVVQGAQGGLQQNPACPGGRPGSPKGRLRREGSGVGYGEKRFQHLFLGGNGALHREGSKVTT